MENQRFSINGIKVTAKHLGDGLYVGMPDNIGEALAAFLSGKLFEPRDIQLLPREEAKPQAEPMPFTPVPPAVPAPTAVPAPPAPKSQPQAKRETITAYRQRTNTSRTAMADLLNISRRSLGRWEQKGKHMDEV